MAYYYSIPIEEMDEELESLRFYPVSLTFRNKPVKEWVYERKLPRSPNHFVRIYTGINRYGPSAGESRQAGKDAIRIQVIYRDTKGETLVSQTKRVHRVGGWRKNLHKRMNEVATELPQVQFDSRGEPMTLRKKGKDYFWGSRDYPKYKETKPFRAEEIRCCKECNKTTGLTTIQAGTYCYDCLPINLGAEEMFYYHGTDMTNLASILKEGIRPTADTDSRWGEDIMDISPYPYYYAEIDDILPSVFVADSVEEARWWADESGIEKIGVLKISSQVENLENFHGDGNGYKTSETIPKEYIVEVIGETFAAEENKSKDFLLNEIKRIWYSPAKKDITYWVEHNMAGDGLLTYSEGFDLPDGSEGLDIAKDEYFERMFDIFLERFESEAQVHSDESHGITIMGKRLLYVPVGTKVNLDSLGNWKNRKADLHGVYGDKITSWIWSDNFTPTVIFGDDNIDHMEGEEGKDFDRIILAADIPWEAIDWESTIAFNISSFWQEGELCVMNQEPVYDLDIYRNGVKESFLDEAMNAEDRLDYMNYLNDLRSYPELKNLSDEQLLARGIDCLASQTANQEKNSEDNQSDNLIWDEEAGLFYDYIQLPQPDGELIVPYWILNEELDQVGKAQISLFNNNLEIDSIFIEPYYQRRGIATSFVNHVVNYWDSELLRFSDTVSDEGVAFVDSFAADDYDATYGKEQAKIRRKLKNKIKKQAIMGTKAGQWSARKSQELKRQYEAACDKKGLNPYKGKKTKSQDNLSKWSKQKWGTASGRKSSVTGEPYFPAKAVAALKKKDLYAKAKRQKAKATRAGKQNARYSDDIRKVVAKYRAESPDWEDIDWKTDEPPAKKGPEDWGDDVEWDAEMEWKFPIHDINSMEELIDIYESRERYDNGKLKPYRKAWTHMNLIRSNLFRINFSGVYSCRVIANSSKIIYGNNMLDDLKKGWNSQQTISPVFSRRGTRHRVVSAETPYIPQNKEATLDELITTLKNNNVGWLAKGGSYGPKNLLVFDMKGIVFAIDATPMWSGNIPKTSNWRQLRLDREPLRIKGVLQNGEIEIYGGVPKENVIYETIPSEPYNYADVVKTKTIADLWDAESYLERDSRIRRELDQGLGRAGRDMPMQKYEYRRIKKFKTPEELHEFANHVKGWRDNWEQDKYVYVCDFDWYVKRVTNNPIYTLYGHIIPLSNFASGWSDQRRRDDKLVKRYGAPIFVQSPVMGKIMTTLKDVRKISDEKMGQSNSSMVGHGMKGLTRKINPDEDSVLIINMKGLKFAYGKGYFGEFSDIMVLGGLPVKNVVGHRYKKPEYKTLNEQQHWKVGMDREDFKRMDDRIYGRYKSIYGRGNVANAEEITMKEFDETTADDFVRDSDEQIALMLRKKSKINRYGDIGCPVCGSIGLFSEEIIAKGKKWYCYGCLYEDKEETIKGKGDITLEKYGLEITCPICKKGIKAFNNDSMLRHMKKCGVPK